MIAFLQNMGGQVFEAIWRFENQTVGIVLPEEDADKRRDA